MTGGFGVGCTYLSERRVQPARDVLLSDEDQEASVVVIACRTAVEVGAQARNSMVGFLRCIESQLDVAVELVEALRAAELRSAWTEQ